MTLRSPSPGSVEVIVVGRANIDLAVCVPFRPAAFASPLTAEPGGKSFNQAMTTARLGGRAALVAHAGADAWGQQLAVAENRVVRCAVGFYAGSVSFVEP
jgi:hypothetical protein